MRQFLLRWAVTTVSVMAAAQVVTGVSYDSTAALLVAALLLGVANAVLRPLLMLLTLPFVILTLGLGILFINGVLFYLVGWLLKGFHVASYGAAFWGALIVSVVSFLLNGLVWGQGRPRLYVSTRRGPRPPDEIIDVEKIE